MGKNKPETYVKNRRKFEGEVVMTKIMPVSCLREGENISWCCHLETS